MKYILGYSRSSHAGGAIVKHHLNTVCNTICCARRENTMIYVFQAIDNGAVRESMEVQPKRLGVPDGGVSPCLNVGQHHGCEPKIAIVNETQDTTSHKERIPRS